MCSVNADVALDKCSLSGENSARSVSGSSVLHWYRRYVIAKLSVHHSAAVDLERSESDEKTWTTVPSTMRIKRERDTTGGSLYSVRDRMSDCKRSQLTNAR